MVDTTDLKSVNRKGCTSSSLVPSTTFRGVKNTWDVGRVSYIQKWLRDNFEERGQYLSFLLTGVNLLLYYSGRS